MAVKITEVPLGWYAVTWKQANGSVHWPIRLLPSQIAIVEAVAKRRESVPLYQVAGAKSVLGRLLRVSQWLSRRYAWDVYQARFLILTAVPPWPTAVEVDIEYKWIAALPRARVVLTADPAVSVKAVADSYRAVQARFPDGSGIRKSKNLDVFRFVVASQRGGVPRPSWRALAAAWNSAHPERSYGDRRRFRRDYERGEQAAMSVWLDEDAADALARELERKARRHPRRKSGPLGPRQRGKK